MYADFAYLLWISLWETKYHPSTDKKCVSQMFIAIRTMLTLGIVIMFYSYYYFSFELSFSKILESFSSIA